jgi:hypothetical protein
MNEAEVRVVSAIIKKAIDDRRDDPDDIAQQIIAALDRHRMENSDKHQTHMLSELAGLAQSEGG